MIESFKDAVEHNQRGLSVQGALESVLEDVENISTVLIISLQDGWVKTTFSYDSGLQSLGLLEIAKQDLIDDMRG